MVAVDHFPHYSNLISVKIDHFKFLKILNPPSGKIFEIDSYIYVCTRCVRAASPPERLCLVSGVSLIR